MNGQKPATQASNPNEKTMPAPVKIGLIGLGRWGKVYLKTLLGLRPRCQVTHICTSRPQDMGQTAYPITVLSDWRSVLRSDCEAVILAVPPAVQPEILEAALQLHKPVLAEKPLCLDLATAERLHRLIESSASPVLVDHIHLFNPWFQALKRAIASSGEKIQVILSEGMNLGPFHAHTPALWDWAPHDLSICLDLFGGAPKHLDALAGPPAPNGSPETVSIRLDYPNGAGAWIQAGALSSKKRRQLSVFTDTHWYRMDDLAQEEKVAVFKWSFSARYTQAPPGLQPESHLKPVSNLTPLESLVTYFLDGLSGGDRVYFGTSLALEVIRLLGKVESAIGARNRA